MSHSCNPVLTGGLDTVSTDDVAFYWKRHLGSSRPRHSPYTCESCHTVGLTNVDEELDFGRIIAVPLPTYSAPNERTYEWLVKEQNSVH